MVSPVSNVSFVLLDAAVVDGRGEDPVLGSWSHARLLEEVAAIGGVLRFLGVGVGTPVRIERSDDRDAIVAALATARIGGVVGGEGDDAVVVSDEGHDWPVLLRAGRTDPAAVEVLDPGAAYSPDRTVAEQIAALEATSAPYETRELRTLLQA
jgi:hypothetical protein